MALKLYGARLNAGGHFFLVSVVLNGFPYSRIVPGSLWTVLHLNANAKHNATGFAHNNPVLCRLELFAQWSGHGEHLHLFQVHIKLAPCAVSSESSSISYHTVATGLLDC